MTTNAATYLGHLPNGNPVQRHSADALYAQFGAVIFAIERAGTIAWNCLYRGNIIATAPKHSDCQALARTYLEG